MSTSRTKKFAGVLLLIFLAQCLWLIHAELRSEFGCYPSGNLERQGRVDEGLAQWRGEHIAGTPVPGQDVRRYDPDHSPVWYLVASAPVVLWRSPVDAAHERIWLWLTRIPYLVFGVLLGASLWYVTRRLYGNAGGLIALTLYCFSPGMIQNSSEVCRDSEMGAAWGAFGAIFTAIAVAHTLYAPREVVLWNWRRIGLLGISLGLAVGSQFSLAILVPVTLGLLLYLAPERRRAATAIWAAACVFAGLLIAAGYFFHLTAFWQGLHAARWVDVTPAALAMGANYQNAAGHMVKASPLLILLLPLGLVSYAGWRRARYFGNTAPLLMAVLCLGLALAAPAYPGQGFWLVAIPFLFAFVAGVVADLLETRFAPVLRIVLTALLSGYALWNMVWLALV
jgi:Dolichyl-phosphate-mannose-protein mannosyltransferase